MADQAAILESVAVASLVVAADVGFTDIEEVMERLDVRWDERSNVIEVVFTAAEADLAITGANAIAAEYSDLLQEARSDSLEAALRDLDASVEAVDARIAGLQDEIQTRLEAEPSYSALSSQLSDSLERMVEVQAQLTSATGSELDDLRAELADIMLQIRAYRELADLESQRPGMERLLEEQRQTVIHQSELLRRRDELSAESRLESSGIVMFSPALFVDEVGTDLRRAGAFGLILGVLIASAIAYFLALRTREFEDSGQPELLFMVPPLAEVPNFKAERIKGELPVQDAPLSAAAEAFRFIASAIEIEIEPRLLARGAGKYLADRRFVRSFVFVSPTLEDGKSVVTANTAIALSLQGKRVLAIDADFGHQKLSRLLTRGTIPKTGLTDLVEGELPYWQAAQTISLKEDASIDLLSRGSEAVTAPDFFRSSATRAFFEDLREEYDVVLIDSPPLLQVAYASALVRFSDRVVAVVRHGANVGPAERLAERLELLDTRVIGYVYNKAPLTDEMARTEGSLEDILGR